MFKILWDTIAVSELEKLEPLIRKRIIKKVGELSEIFPSGNIKKLVNSNSFRLRIGDYRVIFSADNLLKILKIIHVRHRKNIYKTN